MKFNADLEGHQYIEIVLDGRISGVVNQTTNWDHAGLYQPKNKYPKTHLRVIDVLRGEHTEVVLPSVINFD